MVGSVSQCGTVITLVWDWRFMHHQCVVSIIKEAFKGGKSKGMGVGSGQKEWKKKKNLTTDLQTIRNRCRGVMVSQVIHRLIR